MQLFDDLEQLIGKEQNEELRSEWRYDFRLASESVFEMFRHRIRTVQQDTVKSLMLSSMSRTTAFHTIDWAQKILPQGFREGQTAYYGKKGMSALVGCFVLRDSSGMTRIISTAHFKSLSLNRELDHPYVCSMPHTM